MTAPAIKFRANVVAHMASDRWVKASEIAFRVGAAEYAVESTLHALRRNGTVRAKRMKDKQRVWCLAAAS